MDCSICGLPLIKREKGEWRTLVVYNSPPEHNHNDNCITRVYSCYNEHKTTFSIRRRCSFVGCNWIGKDSCGCHSGKKIDDWPIVYDNELNGLFEDFPGKNLDRYYWQTVFIDRLNGPFDKGKL